MSEETNYTLITGAGSGLGKAFANEFAIRKHNLILVSLPGENLNGFGQELSEKCKINVVPVEIDLTEENSVFELAGKVVGKYSIDLLVNNAGIGKSMSFETAPTEYLENIINLNIRATTLLTRLLLPELKKQPQSYILNVASMASFSPLVYKTIYPASKAFVYSFSRGLYEELKGSSVFVSVIHPGPMATNKDVTERIKSQGTLGKMSSLKPERVARIAINRLMRKDSLIIPGLSNKFGWFMMKTLPIKLRLHLSAQVFRKEFS